MSDITSRTFNFFRSSEWKEVKLTLRSHSGVAQVKTALIDYLAEWNDLEWIDWEQIEMVLRDLDRAKFWKMIPYHKFLAEAESKVSDEIMVILRKIPY